jgi:hypothetical protein
VCGRLRYAAAYVSHLGDYRCELVTRAAPLVAAEIELQAGRHRIPLTPAGASVSSCRSRLYSIYKRPSGAGRRALGISPERVAESVHFTAASS